RDLRDRLLRGRVQRTDLVHFLMGQRLRPPPLRRTLRTLQRTGDVRVSMPVDARLDRLLRDTELLGELAAGRLPRPYLLATVSHMFCEHALSHWRRATELYGGRPQSTHCSGAVKRFVPRPQRPSVSSPLSCSGPSADPPRRSTARDTAAHWRPPTT